MWKGVTENLKVEEEMIYCLIVASQIMVLRHFIIIIII